MIPYFAFREIMLGPMTIQVWGLTASLGFLVALFLSIKEAKKKNFNAEDIWNIMILSLFGMIVGSKIFYVIFHPDEFKNLEKMFVLPNGGFSLIGGIILATALVFVYAKIKKANILTLADISTPGIVVSIIIIRIGCFFVYDHIGGITSFPWGRTYIDQTIRHPVALYHLTSAIVIFLIICYLGKRRLKEGVLFLVFALCFLIFSFVIDFTRCYDLAVCDSRFGALTYTQWLMLFLMPILVYLLKLKKQSN